MPSKAHFRFHKRLMLAAALLMTTVLSFTFYGSLAAISQNEILAVAQIHVVNTSTGSSNDGSATFISPDGYLITNYHVIKPAVTDKNQQIILCLTLDARKPPVCASMRLQLTAFNEQIDLALLKVAQIQIKQQEGWSDFDTFIKEKDLVVNHVKFNRDATEENINLGERVQILGYPVAGGRSITYTGGVVSGFERKEEGGDWKPWLIKTDAKLNPGGSGGAAFDEQNNYVGVPTLVRGGQGNIGFIISLPVVNAFLDSTLLPIAAGGHPAKTFNLTKASLTKPAK